MKKPFLRHSRFRRAQGDPGRPLRASEAARVASSCSLRPPEAPSRGLSRPRRTLKWSEGAPWIDLGPILGRFGGCRSVWRIGRGVSRSTFVEIHFFCLRERLGLDFAPPRPPFGASFTLLGRFLGPPDRSLGAPVGPKGAFWASSGAASGASGGTLGRSGGPLGSPMAPWVLRGPF